MMDKRDVAIQIEGLKKRYRLGVIGGGTLQGDIQSWWARIRGKDDPNLKIGQTVGSKNETFMALNGIDLTVYKGERLGIIGHNGAGKSTLLKLLSRVTAPTEGKICIEGRVSSMLEVGTGFNGELTGRENIYLNGAILGMSKAEVDGKINQIIEFSECGQFIDTPVKRYSSGMYVKLAFAVAAHLDSEILVMDEVLAVGDMKFQQKCLGKMSDVAQSEGRTVLYVSHNMNTIRQLCSRCIVLSEGKMIYNGDVEEAIRQYMDISVIDDYNIDYTSIPRLDWLNNTKIRTLNAEYVNKANTSFFTKEKAIVRIKWINEHDVNDVSLRIEFLDFTRKPIGTSIINDFYSGKEGQKGIVDVEIDLSMFITGKYTTNYVFFKTNHSGSSENYDCVHGLNFEIVDDSSFVWDEKSWGKLKMSTIKLLRVDSEE